MLTVGYTPVVRASERQAYEAHAQAEGFRNFQFTEKNANGELITAAQRDVYLPVYFIEPYKGNEKVLGYDLASDSIRLAALRMAEQISDMAATAPVSLIQLNEPNKSGIIIYNPLYKTISADHKELTGYFSGVYLLDKIINSALSSHDVNKEMKVRIVDATSTNTQPIFSNVDSNVRGSLTITKRLPLLNRVWEFTFYLTPVGPDGNIVAFAIIGILLSIIIAILMYRIFASETKEVKDSRKRLRANEEQTGMIINTAHDAFILMNEKGIIQDWNKRAETIFGWTRDEAVGRHLAETIIPQRYREMHAKGINHFLETGEGPVLNKRIELSGLRQSEEEFPIELTITALKTEQGYLFASFLQDITERKRNEEALKNKTQQLLEAQELAHIGSWEWDVIANKIEWSDELFRIYGLEPQEFEADYEHFLKYIHPDDSDYVNNIVQQAFKDQQPFNFFHKLIHRDGTTRVLSARGNVYTDSLGNTIRMAGTAQDVTDTKLASQYKSSVTEGELDIPIDADIIEETEGMGIQTEKLIPVYSEEEKQGIMTYFAISKKYKSVMDVEMREDLKTHAVWGPIISRMNEEDAKKQNELSQTQQEDAVLNNNWVPYIHNTIKQGVMYAQMGVSFKDWLDNISLVKKYLVPLIHKEFHDKPEKIISTLWGVDLFIDTVLSILGESYIEEKRKIIKAYKVFTLEQKQLSQYSRSLIEASMDPLVTISANGKITDVNEASVKVTGVPREKLVGTDFTIYFTEPEKAQEAYRHVFEKGFVSDYPLTIKHIQGKNTDVLYNASVYKDEKGNVLGVFAAARDITAQKRLAEKELLRVEELERFRELTVGREMKMMELKKEIEELRKPTPPTDIDR